MEVVMVAVFDDDRITSDQNLVYKVAAVGEVNLIFFSGFEL